MFLSNKCESTRQALGGVSFQTRSRLPVQTKLWSGCGIFVKKECQCGIGTSLPGPDITHRDAVILFPLDPASPTHKYPQRHKIIHGMHPAGRKDRSIDLKIFW